MKSQRSGDVHVNVEMSEANCDSTPNDCNELKSLIHQLAIVHERKLVTHYCPYSYLLSYDTKQMIENYFIET